jgi:hypothetical protein
MNRNDITPTLLIKTWNLKEASNDIILVLHLMKPELNAQERAELHGITYSTYITKAKELGINITKQRDKNKKTEFFELLDSSELNTNIIIKDYAITTVQNYTNAWLKEQTKLLGATISEMKLGVCVYLFEKTTQKTKKTILSK